MKDEEILQESLQEFSNLQAYRAVHAEQWEEIAEILLPESRNTFYYGNYKFPGLKLTDRQVDSTGMIALWRFGAILDSLLTPRNTTWHLLQGEGEYVKKNRAAKLWFEEANRLLFKYRYSPISNFSGQNQCVYQSLGAFGTGPMFVDQAVDENDRPLRAIRYKHMPLGEVFMRENHQGLVNGFCRWFRLTAQQAVSQFRDANGNSTLPTALAERIQNSTSQTPYDFLWRVVPRTDFDRKRKDVKGKPYASYYISLTTNELITEGGFRKFPLCASRYVQAPGEVYGRSPASMVLPTLKTINAIKKDQLTQSHRAVNPVYLTEDDGIVGWSMRPGSLNKGGMRNGKKTVEMLDIGQPSVTDEALSKEAAIIESAFLTDLFKILLGDPKIFTATQIVEMMAQRGILIAPTVGRQQSEYLGPLIDRELDILMSLRLLPPMPPAILEARGEYNVQYASPLQRDQRAQEVAAFQRTLDMATAVANVSGDTSIFDNFDFPTAMPAIADINGVPESWMAGADQMAQKAKARAEAQQRQEAIQAAPAMAALTKANAAAAGKGAQIGPSGQPQPQGPAAGPQPQA